MKLSRLLEKIKITEIVGNSDLVVDNLSQDTREQFTKQTLYFAIPGTQVDGHDYIDKAIEKGASVIVCQNLPLNLKDNICYVLVESVIEKIGYISSSFYKNPSHEIEIIAITGTNGKTTVATELYQALMLLDQKTALFSTAGDFINGSQLEASRKASTSMEVIEFQKSIRKAVDLGCKYLCIEATSHALDQYRLNGTKLKFGIFTNLSQDHLDYHKTIKHYVKSKKRLFDMLDKESFAIVNIDDKYGLKMVSESKAKIISYGNDAFINPISRDYTFEIDNFSMTGTELSINKRQLSVNLIGVFNMYNLVSVYVTLLKLGFNESNIISSLSNIKGARGRMEIVTGERVAVVGVVDYAHTPDALENVLSTLSELPHNRIITVVGVGGDRDREKRPQMAAIAQDKSDHTIYTSDNPRTEDPDQIFSDLLDGCDSNIANYEKIEDRELAIAKAVELAKDGDIILVAGKGHEDYQIIGVTKQHFDDREVLEKYLSK